MLNTLLCIFVQPVWICKLARQVNQRHMRYTREPEPQRCQSFLHFLKKNITIQGFSNKFLIFGKLYLFLWLDLKRKNLNKIFFRYGPLILLVPKTVTRVTGRVAAQHFGSRWGALGFLVWEKYLKKTIKFKFQIILQAFFYVCMLMVSGPRSVEPKRNQKEGW